MVAELGPIPGARVAEHDRLADALGGLAEKDELVVISSACPGTPGESRRRGTYWARVISRCGRWPGATRPGRPPAGLGPAGVRLSRAAAVRQAPVYQYWFLPILLLHRDRLECT